jgi:hypothetical protein
MRHKAIIAKLLERVIPPPRKEIKCVWTMDEIDQRQVGTIWVLFKI